MADQEPPNYSGMIEHYKLKPSIMKQKCSDAIIKAVAARMTEWKLDPLSLGSEKVESIDRECSTEEEKKLKYLKSWRDKFDYKATYELLVERLLEAGNADLAGKVCKLVKGPEHEDADGKYTCQRDIPQPFQAQATHEEPSSSANRDATAIQNPEPTSRPIARGSRGSLDTPGMVGASQEEETGGGAKSSSIVFGDSSPKPVVESEPRSREDKLFSLIDAEKNEKKDLKNQIEQIKKDLETKDGEIKALEKRETQAQLQLIRQENSYKEAQKELTDKEKEVNSLRESLQAKDGELQQQKEKHNTLKQFEEELERERERVAAEAKRLEEVKQEAEARINYIKAANEEREKFQDVLKALNTLMEKVREEEKLMLERRNTRIGWVILILLSTTVILLARRL